MTQTYTCILIDDEPYATALLEVLINELLPQLEVKAKCHTWQEACSSILANHYDIIFTDISIPGKTGIDLLQLVPQRDSEIIFVTAYPDFIGETAARFNSGYILKPVEEQNLLLEVKRATGKLDAKRMTGIAAG